MSLVIQFYGGERKCKIILKDEVIITLGVLVAWFGGHDKDGLCEITSL